MWEVGLELGQQPGNEVYMATTSLVARDQMGNI